MDNIVHIEDRIRMLESEISELRQLVSSQNSQISGLKQLAGGIETAGKKTLEADIAELRQLVVKQTSEIEIFKQSLAAAGAGASNKNQPPVGHGHGGDNGKDDDSSDSDSEDVSPSPPSSPVQFGGMNTSSEGRKRKRPDSAASLSTSKRSLSLGFGNFKGITLSDVTNNNYLRKGTGKSYWTKEQDDQLRAAVAIHGSCDWVSVAETMGNVKNNDQCSSRWRKHISPAAIAKRALRAKNKNPESHAPGEGAGEEGDGEEGDAGAKKSDDAEDKDKEEGDDKAPSYWTEEQDDRLRLAAMKFGFSNWKIVAEFVGDGKSNTQCSSRWRKHISPEAIMRKNAKLKRRMWDPWEDDLLKAFIATNKKVDTPINPNHVNWVGVFDVVGRPEGECKKRMSFFNLTITSGLRYSSKAMQKVLEVLAPQVAATLKKGKKTGAATNA